MVKHCPLLVDWPYWSGNKQNKDSGRKRDHFSNVFGPQMNDFIYSFKVIDCSVIGDGPC